MYIFWGLERCTLCFGDRKRDIGWLCEFVWNNLVALQARSGHGGVKKLRTRNLDFSCNKEENRWYSWMRDKRRTGKEKADMADLNALVNYSVAHRKQARRACEIDGRMLVPGVTVTSADADDSVYLASEGHVFTQLPRACPYEAPLASAAEDVGVCAGAMITSADIEDGPQGTTLRACRDEAYPRAAAGDVQACEGASATPADTEGATANHPFTPSDKGARFLGSPSQDSTVTPADQVRLPISLASSRRVSCVQSVMCQGVAHHQALDLAGASHPLSEDRASQEMDLKNHPECAARVGPLYEEIKKLRIDRKDETYLPKQNEEYGLWMRLYRVDSHKFPMKVSHLRLFACAPDMLRRTGAKWFGSVVGVPGQGWCWTFADLRVLSESFETKDTALADLTRIRRHLYSATQKNPQPDLVRLRRLLWVSEQWRTLVPLIEPPSNIAFAAEKLAKYVRAHMDAPLEAKTPLLGFPNLGNTCYINVVLHCLLNCGPWMQDVTGVQIHGVSPLGDRFRTLSDVYLCADLRPDYIVPLAQLVRQIFVQCPGFQGGRQEDAEECLSQLLKSIDGSYAACDHPLPSSRVFGAPAEAGEANIIRCPVSAEVRAGALSNPIDMCDTLEKSFRGGLVLQSAPPALLVRMENVYDEGNAYYHVDVKATWSRVACDLTCGHGSTVRYRVAALVIYRRGERHYVAFIHSDNTWYLANDQTYRTSTPPTEYPYILVLVKDESAASRVRRRLRGKFAVPLGLQPSACADVSTLNTLRDRVLGHRALNALLQKRMHLERRRMLQFRQFVQDNQVELRARSGDGVCKKLRVRNNKEEKRWYSWMKDDARTDDEKAVMEELNELVKAGRGGGEEAPAHEEEALAQEKEEAEDCDQNQKDLDQDCDQDCHRKDRCQKDRDWKDRDPDCFDSDQKDRHQKDLDWKDRDWKERDWKDRDQKETEKRTERAWRSDSGDDWISGSLKVY